jgi:hypothetical protein
MAARGVATPTGAVAARALSNKGDDPGLTDRVVPPVSEREATGRLGRTWREEVGRGWAGK